MKLVCVNFVLLFILFHSADATCKGLKNTRLKAQAFAVGQYQLSHTLYVHTHKQNASLNCPLSVPQFDPVKKRRKTIMSHSRPCHPTLFTVLRTKARSLSAGTELGAAATAVSSLYWGGPASQQHWFRGRIQALFSSPLKDTFPSSPPHPFMCAPGQRRLFDSAVVAEAKWSYTLLLCHPFNLSPLCSYSSWVNGSTGPATDIFFEIVVPAGECCAECGGLEEIDRRQMFRGESI